jgi:MFS family permease
MTALAAGEESAVRPPSPLARPYRLATIGIIAVVGLLAFEQMAVGTAMPVAARDLHGLPLYAWAFSAVFIAGLVANVFAGGWADAQGPARPLFTGLAVFVAGLVIVGAAPTMIWFIAGRAVQGFGSGLASVPLYVVVARVYPERSRPKVFAAMSGAWVVPSLVGPSIGGLVAQHLGWRWVFLGIVPLVVPAVFALVRTVRGLRGPDQVRAPITGPGPGEGAPHKAKRAMPRERMLAALVLAAGAALLLWGLDHRSVLALVAVLAGIAGVGYGVRALMPRGLARLRRGLPTVIAMRGLLFGAMGGTEAFIPLALTTRFGFHPTTAGLVLTAGAIGWSAGSWWQGRFPGTSPVRFVVAGAVLHAVGVAGVALSFHVSGWPTLPAWIVAGAGMGTAFPALSVLVLRLSGPDTQGANSSAMQISDTLGSSLAVGIAGALVNAAGLNTGAACTAVIAIVAALAAHRVEDAHA